MKTHFFAGIFLLLALQVTSQPLTGIKLIPTDYPTIQTAITALNSSGVGTGGVTFHIDANHTETLLNATAGILTATGTLTDQIIFRKNPLTTGNNPKITAFTPGTTGNVDGIIKIAGGDYITFNGIDLEENTANNTATKQMEWGYALVKKQNTAPFDGCQNVTIKNCTITLNKANPNSVGIYSGNHIATAVTNLSITQRSDACNNSRIDSNFISNVFTGIKMTGHSGASSPYLLYDHFNSIGEYGKNTISDFGGAPSGASAAYGIYAAYQDSLKIMNDSVVGGTGTSVLVAGIHLNAGTSITVWITGNFISVTKGAGGGTHLYGIWNQAGGTPANNTIEIGNNRIIDCTHPTTATGNLYAIYNTGGAATVNIHDNTITGSSYAGTANHYGIFSNASGTAQHIFDNLLEDLTNSSTGGLTMVQAGSFSTSYVYSNELLNSTANGGTVYGIYPASGANIHVYKNNLNGISSNNGATASSLVYGIYNMGGTTAAYIYNNFIAGLGANAATNNPAVVGLHLLGGANIKCYYNSVFLNATSSGTSFGSAAVNVGGSIPFDMRNNILVNTSVPGSTGYTVAYRRSSSTGLTNYASTSNNNCFYAGTPGPNNLIFYNTSVGDQTIGDFQLRVAPRDALSFTELPPFVSGAAPYNLHLEVTTPTFCEGGAAPISTPNIIEDIDADPRYPNPGYPDHPSYPASAPDVGADEFGGIRNDLTPPVINYTRLKNTSSTGARTLTATITDAQSGVPTTSPGLPVLYWKINDAATWNQSVGNSLGAGQFSFGFGAGAILADVVYYYICAQDGFLTPNAGASPSAGAGGFSINPPACVTPPTEPNAYRIVGTLPAGDYRIGGSGSTPSPGCTYVDLTQAFADVNNVVDRITVTNGGTGYNAFTTYVTITGGGGNGALAEADVDEFGVVTGIRVTQNGNGYYKSPQVTITGAGTGATGTAFIGAGKEITGHVNFLVDATYNWLEENAFPIHLEDVVGTSPTKTLTLKPAPATTQTIAAFTGASALKLNGVDYFIIDGSNNGSSSRDLTIQHLSGPSAGAVIWVASASEIDGANYVTIKNCTILGSDASSIVFAGIFSGGTTTVGAAGYALCPNSDNTYDNNLMYWGKNGIVILGKSTAETDSGLTVKNNQLGTETTGQGYTNNGLFLENQQNGLVTGNHIQQVSHNGQSNWVTGIYLWNSKNMLINANQIHAIRQTLSGASWTVDGIYQNTPAFNTSGNPSGNLYTNNVVYDLTSNGSSTYYNVVGIHNAKGWGDQYYYNSVYLTGLLNQTGLSNGSMSACFSNGQGVNSTSTSGIGMKNNVFFINSHTPNGINHHYAHYTTLTSYAGSTLDYNLLYDQVTGSSIGHVGRFNNADQDDILQWRAATSQDPASLSADPLFTSSTNLVPQTGSPVLGAGTPIPGITTDFNGMPRSVSNPSMGAYENSTFTGKQWNGTVSSDWNVDANWTPSGVPAAGDDVMIASATPYNCILTGTTYTCHNLVINPGAVMTLNNGSVLTVNGLSIILNGGTLQNDGTLNLKGDLDNQN